jgi:hypothetical protein
MAMTFWSGRGPPASVRHTAAAPTYIVPGIAEVVKCLDSRSLGAFAQNGEKSMDNLSTTITDITSQIGALELDDHLESHGDGALEASTTAGPATYDCGWPTRTPACR